MLRNVLYIYNNTHERRELVYAINIASYLKFIPIIAIKKQLQQIDYAK